MIMRLFGFALFVFIFLMQYVSILNIVIGISSEKVFKILFVIG